MSILDQAVVQAGRAGGEVTDVRSSPPAASTAYAGAPKSFGLVRLAKRARAEADRIDATQRALVNAGLRDSPYAPALEARDEFEAMARVFDRIRADKTIMDRLQRGVK